MKTLLKSERGTQGFMLLSDARPEQLQQRSQTSKALMSKYTTYNLFKQREKQPLQLEHRFQALLSKQVQHGYDGTQVQPTASHSMHKLHRSLICIPLKHIFFLNSTWFLQASGKLTQTSPHVIPWISWNLCDCQRNQQKCNQWSS